MVIRKRITDPYGSSEDEFQKFRRSGPPKASPKKPSLAERESFVRALKLVPMGETMHRSDFFHTVLDRYSGVTFDIWGQHLYIWPRYQHLPNDRVRCTGTMVGRLNPDARNRKATTVLTSDDQNKWYGQIIYWIEETCYNG